VGSNFLVVVLSSQFFGKIFFKSKEASVLEFVAYNGDWLTLTLLISSFLIPSIVSLIYSNSVRKIVFSETKTIVKESDKAKLLSISFSVATVSFIGWGIGFSSIFIDILRLKLETNIDFLTKIFFFGCLCANLSFVIVYYILDYFNKKLIRIYLRGENLSSIKDAVKIPIIKRFLTYYITVTITPALFFINFILTILSDNQIQGYFDQLLYFSIGFILFTSILTLYVSKTFSRPIQELQNATIQLKQGNLNARVEIDSNDEISFLGERFNEMAESIQEKEFIKDSFGKIVDPSVRDYLLSGNLLLGGELKIVTVLFVDIQGFTSISEKLNPPDVVIWLNQFFETISNCITREKGLVNKFIGDAILAVFGVPVPIKNHADSALQSALSILKEIRELNRKNMENNLPEYKIRIGIHSGEVLAGNIGSQSRMEYTVIGDTVNTASRLESYCKELNLELLLSNDTRINSKSIYNFKPFGEIKIRGKENTIEIYSI
jgi:adenylate cyclase